MGLTDFLFPKACLGCKRGGFYICGSCIEKLPSLKQVCPYCERASVDGFTHVKCKKALGLDGTLALWPYTGVIRKAILGLKYKLAREIAKELSDFAVLSLQKTPMFRGELIIVPIPMYWVKENYRGFNQSELIARLVAKNLGWNFSPDLLVRTKLRRSQTELKGRQRQENIRGVFAIKPSYKLLSTSYLLFDDVYTTGSTLKEAAKVLKRNGAKNVWGLTIAR